MPAPRVSATTTVVAVASAVAAFGLGLAPGTSSPAAASASSSAAATLGPVTSLLPDSSLGSADLARIESEADWILANQTAVGALASHTDLDRIDPYLGNFAALGLARASTATGDARYREAAFAHLSWYVSAMDASDVVYDHQLVSGRYVATDDLDSTDGYSGTFLLAVDELVVPAKDLVKARALHAGVRRAVAAVAMTQQPDGLTWAKPDYRAKYLMDQAEAYAGLAAAARVASLLDDDLLAAEARGRAAEVRSGVEGLWREESGSYDWARHEDGATTPHGGAFYPDAVSQLWAVGFGLVPAQRASALVSDNVEAHPSWTDPSSPTTTGSMYWPAAAWALAVAGRPEAAHEAAGAILAGAASNDRAWPWNSGTSGQAIVALTS